MRAGRVVGVCGVLSAVIVCAFVVLLPVLPDAVSRPETWQRHASPTVAFASVALLGADVVLPVPASLVMTANGALFGLLPGAALSTAGGTTSALLGYGLGRALQRRGRPGPLGDSAPALARFFDRHGTLALVLSRPVPIAAEVVAILAGCAHARPSRFLPAVAAGSLATALPYAVAGSRAAATGAWVPLLLALVIAALAWGSGRLLHRPVGRAAPAPPLDLDSVCATTDTKETT